MSSSNFKSFPKPSAGAMSLPLTDVAIRVAELQCHLAFIRISVYALAHRLDIGPEPLVLRVQ